MCVCVCVCVCLCVGGGRGLPLSVTGSPWQQTRRWNRFLEAGWITCAPNGLERPFPTEFSPLLQDLFLAAAYILAQGCTDTVTGKKAARTCVCCLRFSDKSLIKLKRLKFVVKSFSLSTRWFLGDWHTHCWRNHSKCQPLTVFCQRSEFRPDSRG